MNNEVARRLYYHLLDQGITKTDETLDVEVQLPEGGAGALKGYPFRAEPSHTSHHRKYPPPTEV